MDTPNTSSPVKTPVKASIHVPVEAHGKAPTTAPVKPAPCVQRCALVNLSSGVERKLRKGGNTYDLNLAGPSGYSIRCDVRSPVSSILFAVNGGIYRDTDFPYWMNGNSSGGLTIPKVFYLTRCGLKQVTIRAYDSISKEECFRQTFQLTAKCEVDRRDLRDHNQALA
jgi:hypothetical protein